MDRVLVSKWTDVEEIGDRSKTGSSEGRMASGAKSLPGGAKLGGANVP